MGAVSLNSFTTYAPHTLNKTISFSHHKILFTNVAFLTTNVVFLAPKMSLSCYKYCWYKYCSISHTHTHTLLYTQFTYNVENCQKSETGKLLHTHNDTLLILPHMQCLDFSVTLLVLFLLVCVVYSGLPWLLSWWLTHLASTGVTALTAEYLCMRSELAAIPLSAGSLART